ncbi:hypothetical protein T10_2122 [Trichinella papuae]|uniref:Uncharacterized protein n=1 Tax=Trichinella papuae TaxID=268474 RepID=A0A0V1N3D7_9BILA|nr:hypothetical protein T10_2122 [Trichinella papuae]
MVPTTVDEREEPNYAWEIHGIFYQHISVRFYKRQCYKDGKVACKQTIASPDHFPHFERMFVGKF